MDQLPEDVVERIILFAGKDLKDIGRSARVCRSLRRATSTPHVFQALATMKYGVGIAETSGPMYAFDWKALMIDDNRRGAFPTLMTPVVCNYAYNSDTYFFCCIVQSVKWDRTAQELRVYVDVRGESDLRHPMGSSLTPVTPSGNGTVAPENEAEEAAVAAASGGWGRRRGHLRLFGGLRANPVFDARPDDPAVVHVRHNPGRHEEPFHPTRFVAEMQPTRGHFKGYLAFPATGQMPPGNYTFCYANNSIRYHSDYLPVILFTISREGAGLAEPFQVEHQAAWNDQDLVPPVVCYTHDESPFADDTPELERQRWKATVPEHVLNRGAGAGPRRSRWYV